MRKNDEHLSCRRMSGPLLLLAFLMASSQGVFATLVDFDGSRAWNGAMTHIVRNEQPLSESLPSVLPDYAVGASYQYVQDVYYNKAIAHSGAAAQNPQIYQHVYAYTAPGDGTEYSVQNDTGHSRTFVLSAEDFGRRRGRRAMVRGNVVLDGSLLLMKDASFDDTYKGLNASFDILLTRENGRAIFRGSVELTTNRRGRVIIRTRGGIRRRHISAVTEGDGMFRVDFVNVSIPYRTRILFDREFTINTQVTSEATTQGWGTGAEVVFGPGAPTLPSFRENGLIPEPATVLLLLGGLPGLVLGRRGVLRG